ncbi:MAG: sugar phosphate isomerase/epimerase [Candidatus Promineofilum sp.]|nr:sugar phosphate isomerase/epimerase [Promineifilum sp.]
MRLTMSGEVFSHYLPLDRTLEITTSFRIRNFELWAKNIQPLSNSCHDRLYRDRDIEQAKKQFKASGVQIACVAFGGAFHQEVASDVGLYTSELIRAIEIAADLEAGLVNHYCNLIAPQFNLDFDILEHYWSAPLKRAETLGVTLVLENEAHDMTHTPENVLAIIEHFRSKNFRSNLDATNFYQAGNEAFPHCYEILRDVIAYVHIKNGCIFDSGHEFDASWVGGKMSGHHAGRNIYYTLPTKGAVNMTGLLERLKADGYAGYITLEPHSNLTNTLAYYESAIPWLRESIS